MTGALKGLSQAWQAQEMFNQMEWKHSVRVEISSRQILITTGGDSQEAGSKSKAARLLTQNIAVQKVLPQSEMVCATRGKHLDLPGAMESRVLSTSAGTFYSHQLRP